jgi:soluble lytic murein transglycosylase-like protein
VLTLAALAASTTLNCWVAAGQFHNVPPTLLSAIAEVESAHRPEAIAHARNGTYSVGLMQINSGWFELLGRYGISEEMLFEPCVNIHVGAWILAQEIRRYGPTWEAIGAYYAGAYDKRSMHWKLPHYRRYALRVLAAWKAQGTIDPAELPMPRERTSKTHVVSAARPPRP